MTLSLLSGCPRAPNLIHLQVSETAAAPTASAIHGDHGREEGSDDNGDGDGDGNGNGKGGVAEAGNRGSSILPERDGYARTGGGDGAAARLMRSTEAARELGMAYSV